MDFLGIGPAELVMIVVLLLLFLGPSDVVELFRKFGRLIRRLRASPTWNVINSTAQTLRKLPNTLAEEAGMEEIRKDLQRNAETSRSIGRRPESGGEDAQQPMPDGDLSSWVTPPPGPSVVPPPAGYRTHRPDPDTEAADPADGGTQTSSEEETPKDE